MGEGLWLQMTGALQNTTDDHHKVVKMIQH